MKFFRNIEVAKTYHVSKNAVTNWVAAAKGGKLGLELIKVGNRSYIANTAQNISIIEQISKERRKFRTTKAHKIIRPDEKFYDTYSPDQVSDIISNLEIHHEVPRQYSYFGNGAALWDQDVQHAIKQSTNNDASATIYLLSTNYQFLDGLLSPYKKVNVIDIGPGNAMPVRGLLQHLIDKDMLGRYLAIDISPEIVEIARQNIDKWFGGKVDFEGELRDITFERFKDIMPLDTDGSETVNLLLFLGSTRNNFRAPQDAFNTIYNSMGTSDILICSERLDTESNRRLFNLDIVDGAPALSLYHRHTLELLNIDPSLYEVEVGFNAQRHERFRTIRLKSAISIEFSRSNKTKTVRFNKGDVLLVWRYWHNSLLEVLHQFDDAGLQLLQSNCTTDGEFVLTIHKAKMIKL